MLSYAPASKHVVFVNVHGFNLLLSPLHFAQELEQTREEVEVMYTGTDRLRSEYQRLCAGTRDLLATLRYQKPSTMYREYQVQNTRSIRDLFASCNTHAPIPFLENVLILWAPE